MRPPRPWFPFAAALLVVALLPWAGTATVVRAAPPVPAPPPPAPAPAPPAPDVRPSIELVTMGIGDDLFHRWGHAALCVVYEGQPERDVCYNYGAAFPTSVASLGWHFLRGTAKFMVILQPYQNMIDIYRDWDRSVWVQRLPLDAAQVDRMVKRLQDDLREENRTYTYHHMWDNCATRLRDHIDAVTGGALRVNGKRGIGVTFRDLARRGLAGRPLLVLGTTLGFGRRLDQEVTRWDSMGHPDYLRQVVQENLGARPEQIYKRQGKPLPPDPGYGHGLLIGLALFLALAVVVSRRFGRFERLAAITAVSVLTLIGALLWFTALVSRVPELYLNEALLVFWPTDFLLLRLHGRRREIYRFVRIGGLLVVSALLAVGVLVQPLYTAVLVPLLVCIALRWPARPA